jgi:hypothetical protein
MKFIVSILSVIIGFFLIFLSENGYSNIILYYIIFIIILFITMVASFVIYNRVNKNKIERSN